MVKPNNPIIKSEIDKLNDKETLAVVNYISQILSSRLAQKSDSPNSDDLIASLSNQRENQRARQVFEWEKVRRYNVQRTV